MKKYLFLYVLFFSGCVDVRPDATEVTTRELDSVTLDGQYQNVKFECGLDVCESKKQYCFKSTREFEGPNYLIQTCLERPKACGDCTCMRADAQYQIRGAKNCKGEIHCAQDDSLLIVTCVAPKETPEL